MIRCQVAQKLKDKGIYVMSSTEAINMNTPDGVYNFTNLLNAAELERKMTSKRVSDALQNVKKIYHHCLLATS